MICSHWNSHKTNYYASSLPCHKTQLPWVVLILSCPWFSIHLFTKFDRCIHQKSLNKCFVKLWENVGSLLHCMLPVAISEMFNGETKWRQIRDRAARIKPFVVKKNHRFFNHVNFQAHLTHTQKLPIAMQQRTKKGLFLNFITLFSSFHCQRFSNWWYLVWWTWIFMSVARWICST